MSDELSQGAFDQVDDMFGIQENEAERIVAEDNTSNANPDFYRPSIDHKNAKNKTYSARGRFVPNPHDPNVHILQKWIYYMQDPEDPSRKFYVDCPSNEGKKNNIITEAYFHMYKHEYATFRNVGKQNFQRKSYWWALFNIMIDQQEPELEGKIKIFRFGNQIHDKIVAQATANEALGTQAVTIYHPFKGKDLLLHIEEENYDGGQKGVTYKNSEFDGAVTTFSLDGGKTRVPMTQEAAVEVKEFIAKESPDMSQLYYQPWDTELEDKVIVAVRNLIDDEPTFEIVMNKAYKSGALKRLHVAVENMAKRGAGVESGGSVSTDMKVDMEGAAANGIEMEEASFEGDSNDKAESPQTSSTTDQAKTEEQAPAVEQKVVQQDAPKQETPAEAKAETPAEEIDSEVDNIKAGLASEEAPTEESTEGIQFDDLDNSDINFDDLDED